MRGVIAKWRRVLVTGLACAALGCGAGTGELPDIVTGDCSRDRACPLGSECTGGECVPVRPTLYPSIQVASPLLRAHNDDNEPIWRATHADLVIGRSLGFADRMRAANANVRVFEYFTNKYYVYQGHGDPWAVAHGYDPEDFYLHYKEDVFIAAYATTVLVPGFPAGIVPGWNPAWQQGNPPASATERWQSRVPGTPDPNRGPWYLANLTHPGYRSFLVDFAKRLLDGSLYDLTLASGPLDGVIVDNAIYYPSYDEGMLQKSVEFYGVSLDDNHPYGIGVEQFYPELQTALNQRYGASYDVTPNYGHVLFLNLTDRFSQSVQSYVDWVWAEVWVTHRSGSSPTSGPTRVITYNRDYGNGIANMVRQSRAGGRRIIGARDNSAGVGGTEGGKLFTLALYYLVHNANTFYVYEASRDHMEPSDIEIWQWNPAVQVDIGVPAPVPQGRVDFEGKSGTTEHYELATGPDPYNPALAYHLLARNFTRGMVLTKMLPDGSVVGDPSATTHTLPGPYAAVRADGTLGPIVTEVTIRNNEGIILVKP